MDESDDRRPPQENLQEVLASIRELVTAETSARLVGSDSTLMLTDDMRIDGGGGDAGESRSSEILPDHLAEDRSGGAPAAPILDEEAIRSVVNRIVREELQGELGDRISRNLRKLIRREIAQIGEEHAGRNEVEPPTSDDPKS